MSGLSLSVATLPSGDGVCCVISLAGEADLTAASLREALAAEVGARPRLLLVDMSALTFIDSAATQMIVAAYHVLRREGGTLGIVSPTPTVARVLALLGVDRLIHVHDSVSAAMASVA